MEIYLNVTVVAKFWNAGHKTSEVRGIISALIRTGDPRGALSHPTEVLEEEPPKKIFAF